MINQIENTTAEPNGSKERRLYYLHDLLEYKVHENDPDVRGWNLVSNHGATVGKVDNLIVDKLEMKVRYLEVDVDNEFRSTFCGCSAVDLKSSNRKILVPIGLVNTDNDAKQLEISGISLEAIGAVPRFTSRDVLSPRVEIRTLSHFADNHSEYGSTFNRSRYRDFDEGLFKGLDRGFYNSGFFSDKRFYNRHKEAITSSEL